MFVYQLLILKASPEGAGGVFLASVYITSVLPLYKFPVMLVEMYNYIRCSNRIVIDGFPVYLTRCIVYVVTVKPVSVHVCIIFVQ